LKEKIIGGRNINMARVTKQLKGNQYKIAAQAGNPKKIEKADFKKLAQLRKGKKNGTSKKSKIA
tara:strand:- start:2 stop:193 length:192 start_codon:yes stop_codon:yes gene_type:complete